ncbi:aspartyl/asparaginyl beta-hydroxylase domain-containing protein [Saccharothrix syringae]|uniref:Aspartyl/asparaginyl beta-hydroxylase domain-containing protein n=1 Tax=Saccharothrix syringae TaxID=103733 RepID=A0A5Q0H4X3_SACSY|nr:aspartyl/asparaginyl beta-hydroxylase domain-containing protein [Saccharothrix syringae]QFZ21209.1 aspartyl/asparaginyl beta-hydroxylase domain-containing protein [Saccharothrix syringae]
MTTPPYRLCEAHVGSHPSAVRLLPTFDLQRLLADLKTLDGHQWALQQTFETDGPAEEADFDWRALPLRSPTGSELRTDPGGAGLDDFADTKWLAEAPYLAEVLASIPAPLRCVRLLALGPGAQSELHFDTKIGFPWGNLRLHVPLVTNPGATLLMDGDVHVWEPGTFWFGDFCRLHQVENTGTRKRVHMVIDTTLTPEVLSLFPAEFLEALDADEVLFNRPAVPCDDLARHQCEFEVPLSFLDFEEAEGEFTKPQEHLPASVRIDGDRLVLAVSGEPRFGLVHVGDGEFRFSGWTDERTVQVLPGGDRATVVLRTRQGTREQRLDVPAVVGAPAV